MAKNATIIQDPMTSLDPIKTIGSQIVEVIVKHQGKSAKEPKKMAIDYMDKVGIPDAEKRFKLLYGYFADMYALPMVVALAFRIDTSGAATVRNALLERLCRRKEKQVLWVSIDRPMCEC